MLVVSCLLLSACSSQPQQAVQLQAASGDDAAAAGPLALPFPDSEHLPSVQVSDRVYGADYSAELPNHLVHALTGKAVFSPLPGQDLSSAAFATYQLKFNSNQASVGLSFDWDLPPAEGEAVWIGLSNWRLARWQFQQLPEGNSIELSAPTDYLTAGGDLLVVVLKQAGGEIRLNRISFDYTSNRFPVAIFSASPSEAAPGQPMLFDASASVDLDGIIVEYRWDLDDDGTADSVTEEPLLEHTFVDSPDTPTVQRRVSLVVVDDDGATNYAYTYVISGMRWSFQGLAGGSEPAYDMEMLVADGHPAVAYYDLNTNVLSYSRADNADGLGEWSIVQLGGDNFDHFAEEEHLPNLSMCLIDGCPAIAAQGFRSGSEDEHLGYIDFLIADDSDGNGRWAGSVVRNDGDCGYWLSLAEVDGRPAIAYEDKLHENGPGELCFAWSTDPRGLSGWDFEYVRTGTDDPLRVSNVDMQPFEDYLAIAYLDPDDDIAIAWSAAPETEGAWSSTTISEYNNLDLDQRRRIDLAAIAGQPAIALGLQQDTAYFHLAGDSPGGGWTESMIAAARGGSFNVLLEFEGLPLICHNGSRPQLLSSASVSGAGESDWTLTQTEAMRELEARGAFAIVDGRPAFCAPWDEPGADGIAFAHYRLPGIAP